MNFITRASLSALRFSFLAIPAFTAHKKKQNYLKFSIFMILFLYKLIGILNKLHFGLSSTAVAFDAILEGTRLLRAIRNPRYLFFLLLLILQFLQLIFLLEEVLLELGVINNELINITLVFVEELLFE